MKIPRFQISPSNWSSQRDRRHDDLNVDGEVLSIQVASWHCAPDICKDMSSKSCHLSCSRFSAPKKNTADREFFWQKIQTTCRVDSWTAITSPFNPSKIQHQILQSGRFRKSAACWFFLGWKRDKALSFALQPLQPRYWNVYSSQAIGMANSNNAVTMWAFWSICLLYFASRNKRQNSMSMSNQHQHHLVRPVPSIIRLSWVSWRSSIFELLEPVSPHVFNSIYWQVQ